MSFPQYAGDNNAATIGAAGSITECDLTVQIGTMVFDCATPDFDGIIWTVEEIENWWTNSTVESNIEASSGIGDTITRVSERGRRIVVKGGAHYSEETGLGSLWFVAEKTLKRNMRFMYVPGIMFVSEPDGSTWEMSVRRIEERIRITREGDLTLLKFEIPLFGPDPHRYA